LIIAVLENRYVWKQREFLWFAACDRETPLSNRSLPIWNTEVAAEQFQRRPSLTALSKDTNDMRSGVQVLAKPFSEKVSPIHRAFSIQEEIAYFFLAVSL
jgi:hypothetical protein